MCAYIKHRHVDIILYIEATGHWIKVIIWTTTARGITRWQFVFYPNATCTTIPPRAFPIKSVSFDRWCACRPSVQLHRTAADICVYVVAMDNRIRTLVYRRLAIVSSSKTIVSLTSKRMDVPRRRVVWPAAFRSAVCSRSAKRIGRNSPDPPTKREYTCTQVSRRLQQTGRTKRERVYSP